MSARGRSLPARSSFRQVLWPSIARQRLALHEPSCHAVRHGGLLRRRHGRADEGVHRGPQADRAGNGQRVPPVEEPELASAHVLAHARRTDVYVGCAPRTRRAGPRTPSDRSGRSGPSATEPDRSRRSSASTPAPSLIIGSGSGVNCHAYWPLVEPLTPPAAEAANLRIAIALGADLACFDASRILRPPGTWNHKRQPPTRVATLHLERDRRFAAEDVLVAFRRSATSGWSAVAPATAAHVPTTTRCSRSLLESTSPISSAARPAQSQGLVPVPRGLSAEPACVPDAGARLVLLLLRSWRNDLRPRRRPVGDDPARARLHRAPRAAHRSIRRRDRPTLRCTDWSGDDQAADRRAGRRTTRHDARLGLGTGAQGHDPERRLGRYRRFREEAIDSGSASSRAQRASSEHGGPDVHDSDITWLG